MLKNFEISFCFPMCILSKHQQNVLQKPWGCTHSLSRLPLRRPFNTKEHSDFVKNGSLLSWFKPPDTIFRESTSSTKRLPPKKENNFSRQHLKPHRKWEFVLFFERNQSCTSKIQKKENAQILKKIKLDKDLMNEYFLLGVLEFWTKDLIIYGV